VRAISISALVLAILLPAAAASARTTEEYTYNFDQLWRSAVRLIAVDYRFPITDRDEQIGYLLFEYREAGRTYAGSVELVRTRARDGGENIRVVMQVNSMPSYVERMLLDRLSRKLTEEYGAPPPRRREPAPAPPAEEAPEEDGEDESPAD
jgi:hypothetical protein